MVVGGFVVHDLYVGNNIKLLSVGGKGRTDFFRWHINIFHSFRDITHMQKIKSVMVATAANPKKWNVL